ncbi:flagellar hook-length control protein FliK [Tritonibacter mobilis]|uniref:flagellar hook-length control protein FliK n=1 Tax=Tritonibacter mobilis TaxID=379347 RepID=UPI003A5BFD3F
MIDKILTTQSVGSTSTESSKRTEPARRGGDSFESVLAREAKTKDKTKTSPDVETPAGAENDDKAFDAENNAKATAADQHAKGEESHPEQDAGETSLVAPDENPESESASVLDTATQSDVEEALDEALPELDTSAEDFAQADVAEGQAVAAAGATQVSSDQSAKGSGDQVTRAGAPVTHGSATDKAVEVAIKGAASAEADAEMNSMEAARTGLLSDKDERLGTSVLLETHRDGRRQQLVPGTVGAIAAEKGAQPPAQAQVAASTATARAPMNSGDTRLLHPAASGSAQALASARFQMSDTVLKSSSAVVTSLMGANDAGRVGEDVLTQRGAESFALPQLLAEASVRSGASSFRAETPRHVAQQLAEAVATGGKRNVDVTLNPRELGHVNMRVMTTEMGVTITINAERPETEDLMRRHIQDLAREFKEMGFTDISFQFGSDTDAGQSGEGESSLGGNGSEQQGEGDALEAAQSGLPISQHLNISADGLDMRI